MKVLINRILFLILTLGGGSMIGILTRPDIWYTQLTKPSFNPPNWIFAPVWTALYICIALAGSRTWTRDKHSAAMKLWFLQLFLNFLWTPVFFGLHRIDVALVVIILLLVASIAYFFQTYGRDKIANALFLPYILWTSFAALLNAVLLMLN